MSKFWDEVFENNPDYMRNEKEGVNNPSRAWSCDFLSAYASVLDVGCGNGIELESLRAKGNSIAYAGCDYSEKAIEICRAKFPEDEFLIADSKTLEGIPDASYDVVYLRHVLDPNDGWKESVLSAWRVARKALIINQWQIGPEEEGDPPDKGLDGYSILFSRKRFPEWAKTALSPAPESCEVVTIANKDVPRRIDTIYAIKKI